MSYISLLMQRKYKERKKYREEVAQSSQNARTTMIAFRTTTVPQFVFASRYRTQW